MAGNHFDLLIAADSIVLDAFGLPLTIDGRQSIAQDIKHMVRESGLLVEIVGERSGQKIKRNMVRIEQLIENDVRIVPGTARVTQTDVGEFYLTATTLEYGDIELGI